MPETTQTAKEEILPGKHSNGSTERLHRMHVDKSLRGLFETSCELTEQTANREMESGVSRACGVHVANGISAIKTEVSLVRNYENAKTPAAKRYIAGLLGAEGRALLALEAPKKGEAAEAASPGKVS